MDTATICLLVIPVLGLVLLAIDFNSQPRVSIAIIIPILLLSILVFSLYNIGEQPHAQSIQKEDTNVTTK